MVVVPVAIPVAIPVETPMVATAGVLLIHTPPVTTSDNVMVVPTHWLVGPLMGLTTGTGLTVMILLAELAPQLLATT